MDKKYIIVILILIIIVGSLVAYSLMNTNDSLNNDNNKTGNSSVNITENHTKVDNMSKNMDNNVVAKQSGPDKVSYGEKIIITCTISNNCNKPIENVHIASQELDKNLGTIAPGKSELVNYTIQIPSKEQFEEDFNITTKPNEPFYIGGFGLTYDIDGKTMSTSSNALNIPWDI